MPTLANAADAVTRWETLDNVPSELRQAIKNLAAHHVATRIGQPFADEYRNGLFESMVEVIAAFGLSRKEARLVVETYIHDLM